LTGRYQFGRVIHCQLSSLRNGGATLQAVSNEFNRDQITTAAAASGGLAPWAT
jgi:hypothetical protein